MSASAVAFVSCCGYFGSLRAGVRLYRLHWNAVVVVSGVSGSGSGFLGSTGVAWFCRCCDVGDRCVY